MAKITHVDSTEEGWLFVEVDFEDGHVNDFLFPDLTSEHEVEATVISVIRDWRLRHPDLGGDQRSPHLTLTGKDHKGAVALVKHLEGTTL